MMRLSWLLWTVSVVAQDRLATGSLLVARHELTDPNFAASVVLVVRHSEQGAMGLILNRATEREISAIISDLKGTVYQGGPVSPRQVYALLRNPKKKPDEKAIVEDVYLMSERAQLNSAREYRVFQGYAGWGPGQLENEVRLGAWHVVAATADLVFAVDPEKLWLRLIERTEQRVADGGATLPEMGRPQIQSGPER